MVRGSKESRWKMHKVKKVTGAANLKGISPPAITIWQTRSCGRALMTCRGSLMALEEHQNKEKGRRREALDALGDGKNAEK